jgi:hypothetical protein
MVGHIFEVLLGGWAASLALFAWSVERNVAEIRRLLASRVDLTDEKPRK